MKLVIADPKDGKSYKVELDKTKESAIIGKKIGDSVDGGTIGAAGYSFELTGGSDTSGFPMRRDMSGTRKASVLLSKGTGFNAKRDGERRKKMVRGTAYSSDIIQVNAKIVQPGPTPLGEIFKQEPKKEEKK